MFNQINIEKDLFLNYIIYFILCGLYSTEWLNELSYISSEIWRLALSCAALDAVTLCSGRQSTHTTATAPAAALQVGDQNIKFELINF